MSLFAKLIKAEPFGGFQLSTHGVFVRWRSSLSLSQRVGAFCTCSDWWDYSRDLMTAANQRWSSHGISLFLTRRIKLEARSLCLRSRRSRGPGQVPIGRTGLCWNAQFYPSQHHNIGIYCVAYAQHINYYILLEFVRYIFQTPLCLMYFTCNIVFWLYHNYIISFTISI